MKYRYLSLIILAAFAAQGHAQISSGKSAPKLVVNISIDQLRTDY